MQLRRDSVSSVAGGVALNGSILIPSVIHSHSDEDSSGGDSNDSPLFFSGHNPRETSGDTTDDFDSDDELLLSQKLPQSISPNHEATVKEDSEEDVTRDYLQNIGIETFDGLDDFHSSFKATLLETPQTQIIQSHRSNLKKSGQRKTTKDIAQGVHDLIDSLEILDPAENEFDVTDFDRPSLQRRRKKGEPPIFSSVSDGESQEQLRLVWTKDREKKKARKQERQALRKLGLLNSEPLSDSDLKLKYPYFMTLVDIKTEFHDFLCSEHEWYVLNLMAVVVECI
jgi:hypothetical protein